MIQINNLYCKQFSFCNYESQIKLVIIQTASKQKNNSPKTW